MDAQAENGPVEVGGDVEATSGNGKKRKDEEMRDTYSGLLCTVERRGPTNGFSSRCEHAITWIGLGAAFARQQQCCCCKKKRWKC